MAVKDNQPLLRQDIEDAFEAPQQLGLTQQEMASMRTVRDVTMHRLRRQSDRRAGVEYI